MRLGNKTLPSIYQILGLLLIVSIWAFNEEKYITYPIKIVFILVYGYYWLRTSRGTINKYQGWCLLMCIASFSAAFFAADSNMAVRTLINVLQCFLIAFTLSAYIREKDQVIQYLKYFAFGGLILFIRLLLVTPISVWTSFSRLGAEIGYNANDVGNKAAIAAIISICLFRNRDETHRKFYAVLYVLLTAIVLFSGSRKALLALVIATIMIYTVGLEKKRNMVFSVIGLIIVLYIGYQYIMTNESLYQTIGRRIESMINVALYGGSEASSIDLRERYMAIAWSLIKDNPILGIGLGNFASVSGLGIYCHCDYLEVMCSYGIPIALLYYFPVVSLLLRGMTLKHKNTLDYSCIIICFVLLISFVTMVMYVSAYTQIIVAIIYAYFGSRSREWIAE